MNAASHWILTFLTCVTTFVTSVTSVDPQFTPVTLSDGVGNNADKTGTIIWSQLPTASPSVIKDGGELSGSLTTFYNMMHGFVDAVFIKGIPTEAVQSAIDGDMESILSDYTKYIPYVIGYGICAVVGLLFLLIFPVVTCCFCCCRCCCGGKNNQSDEEARNTCRKVTFTLVLVGALAFTIAGTACMKLTNDKMSSAIEAVPSASRQSFDELEKFVSDSVKQARHVTGPNFDFLQQVIFRDLDNIAYLVGLPVRQTIEGQTDIRVTLSGARDLAREFNATSTTLKDVSTQATSLPTSISQLTSKLATVKTDVDNILANCGGAGCPTTGRPDLSPLGTTVTVNFPDLSAQTSSMNTAQGADMEALLTQVEDELDDIPTKVETESAAARQDIKTAITDMKTELDPILGYIDDADDYVTGDKAESVVNPIQDTIDEFGQLATKYDKYRWYAGVGVSALLLVVSLVAVLGLAFGLVGSDSSTHPADRGCVPNCGGTCLIVFVWCSMLLCTPLMLLTTVPFMVGSPLQAFVCKPISDVDVLSDLVDTFVGSTDGYPLGKLVLDNKSIPLTLAGILRDCQNGRSVYDAFKLDSRFNISEILDYSKYLDIQSEVDKVTVDLSTVDVYPTTLEDQLDDIKAAINIDFGTIYSELSNPPLSLQTDLDNLAMELDRYADTLVYLPIPSAKAELKTQADAVRNIRNTELKDLIDGMNSLNTTVATLDGHVTKINVRMTSLEAGLQRADGYIKTNTSADISNVLRDYANRLKGIVDSYIDNTLDAVKHDIGTCSPLWNVYNTLLRHALCNVVDTFNGMWFALGWCVFFLLPGMISSVKLARFYSRAGGNKVHPTGPMYGPGTKQSAWNRMRDRNKIHPSQRDQIDDNPWKKRIQNVEEF